MKAALFAQANIIEWYLNNCLDGFKKRNNDNESVLDIVKKQNIGLYDNVKYVLENN